MAFFGKLVFYFDETYGFLTIHKINLKAGCYVWHIIIYLYTIYTVNVITVQT